MGLDVKGELDSDVTIFNFNTEKFNQTERVKFHYAFKGRNGNPGVFDRVKGKALGKSVLMVQSKAKRKVSKFFDEWKVPYDEYDMTFRGNKKE